MTTSTATGRRRQLFSPVPERNGSAKSSPIATTGPVSISGVSIYAGSSANAEKNQRKKKSGRGTVWMIVGSGWPFGPMGPKTAAHATQARMMSPAKTRSAAPRRERTARRRLRPAPRTRSR